MLTMEFPRITRPYTNTEAAAINAAVRIMSSRVRKLHLQTEFPLRPDLFCPEPNPEEPDVWSIEEIIVRHRRFNACVGSLIISQLAIAMTRAMLQMPKLQRLDICLRAWEHTELEDGHHFLFDARGSLGSWRLVDPRFSLYGLNKWVPYVSGRRWSAPDEAVRNWDQFLRGRLCD